MHPVADETTPGTPMCEEDKKKVREQMHRLLETHHFKNSRRYPALLRFIVEEALEGRGEYLKERLLGVRVFDRPADYDTAADPIVRVTIAEIRKRIAQYYHDEAHDAEMRIELLPGRYAPEFRSRRESAIDPRHAAESTEGHEALEAENRSHEPMVAGDAATAAGRLEQARPKRPIYRRGWFGVASLVVLMVAAASGPLWRWSHPSALEELWRPLLATRRPILFCLPAGAGRKGGAAMMTGNEPGPEALGSSGGPSGKVSSFLDHEAVGENVVFSDVLATLKISDLLAAHNHEYRLRLNVSTTLDDLRQGPTILIGGLDNQWTMRAIAPLRFHFLGSDEDQYWIDDAKNPGKKDWALDLKTQYAAVNHDFALIARVHNEQTGQLEVVVAGIGMSGTAAAGEFLADPHQVEELRRRVGAGFRDRDFEAVLSTDVVNGIAGSPKILAVAVW